MDGVYAENAGAIFGRCLDDRIPKTKRLGLRRPVCAENVGECPSIAGMPE